MKTKKTPKKKRKASRPRDVWNSVRKLEGFIRKADIQAGVFLESLQRLRDAVLFEVKRDIVKGLCSSVNGDILNELLQHKIKMSVGSPGISMEHNAILMGIFDTLANVLDLSPYRMQGERFAINKASAKDYIFENYPESLDKEEVDRIEAVVLRPGWKIQGKVVVKPTVFEAGAKRDVAYEMPDPLSDTTLL